MYKGSNEADRSMTAGRVLTGQPEVRVRSAQMHRSRLTSALCLEPDPIVVLQLKQKQNNVLASRVNDEHEQFGWSTKSEDAFWFLLLL